MPSFITPIHEFNPNHEPAGSEKGGQFASAKLAGGQIDTGTPAFKLWFGRSKVVDSSGQPRVVYHGGAKGITSFDASHAGSVQVSDWGAGIYFTPSRGAAEIYAEEAALHADAADSRLWEEYEAAARAMGTTPMMAGIDLGHGTEKYQQLGEHEKRWRANREKVRREAGALAETYSVYLRVQNPLVYTYEGITDPFLVQQAKAHGHDGVFIVNQVGTLEEIVVFGPEQIMFATSAGRTR